MLTERAASHESRSWRRLAPAADETFFRAEHFTRTKKSWLTRAAEARIASASAAGRSSWVHRSTARYGCRRPYRDEYTGSLPNSEVNRRRALSVGEWGTVSEAIRVLPAFFPVASHSTRAADIRAAQIEYNEAAWPGRGLSTVLAQDHFCSDFLISQPTVSTNSHILEDEFAWLSSRR